MLGDNCILNKKSISETPQSDTIHADVCERIVLILDASGSMQSQKSDVIGGINETILQQRKLNSSENPHIKFNVVQFNDSVASPTESTLDVAAFLTNEDYVTRGGTALFDAIGFTIELYKAERNVVFLVMTDGQENSSRNFTHSQVTNLINTMIESNNWNFVYLSEDLSTFQQGQSVGINSSYKNCNNLMTGKNRLGSVLAENSCQVAISKMVKCQPNVKISSYPEAPQVQPPNPPQQTESSTSSVSSIGSRLFGFLYK